MRVISVTDGDTLVTDEGTVRAYGVDASENCAPCYQAAKERLKALAGQAVRLEEGPRREDSGGRMLAYLYTEDGMSIDEALIKEGLAEAWKQDGQHRDWLVALEEVARRARSGCLWGGSILATPTVTPRPVNAPPTVAPLRQLNVERVWPWLDVNDPLFLSSVPGSHNCVAVVSQDGVILTVTADPDAAQGSAGTFLDIHAKVNRGGNEEGFLGLAFHPHYASNGRLFVYYSAASPRRSVISEFTAGPAGRADTSTERIIMEVAQPFANHNGGMLAFGPDGYLYIGLGDGGSGGDPQGHGQDVDTLLGSILRIDIDRTEGVKAYAVPNDNRFVKGGGAPEIWAYGLRNPWRFSFDPITSQMWAGDVGQNALEEIDIIRPGGNYGWNIMEGDRCFRPSTGCDRSGLEMPLAVYGRDSGCSVTGGYVYRGSRLSSLYGAYVYADYCSGRIWALRHDGLKVTEQVQVADTDLSISSFGEGPDGELYVVDHSGRIYRFASP